MPEGVKSHDHLAKAELDRELNDALQGTFPASDPVASRDGEDLVFAHGSLTPHKSRPC